MLTLLATVALTQASPQSKIDRYLEQRFDQTPQTTQSLADSLSESGAKIEDVERALRRGPVLQGAPATRGQILGKQPLQADHVDYATSYYLYVPKSYEATRPTGLLVVGHGGNGAMSRAYADMTARAYIGDWPAEAERRGWIVVAPLTVRGWGWIGDSIVFSLISKLSRQFNIDPNRVYLTGHSMGGHLSWRSAFGYPDRWAAVSPMSGGYDYVAQGLMPLLHGVSGYATHGSTEPYEIADFNRKMKGWLDKRKFDWIIDERPGGHEVFKDRLPIIGDFFAARTRNIYPSSVYAQQEGPFQLEKADAKREQWDRGHAWVKGRPIDRTTFFWLRLDPEEGKEAPEKVRKAYAEIKGRDRIEITAENVRSITVYLHPKMVEFGKPVTIVVNGEENSVTPSPKIPVLLEEVRRFDDRGRLFWDKVTLPVKSDKSVPEPGRSPRLR